ncbi:MAG: hypothetical protein FWG02_03465 [Holophagaceae bacterium]|nr:hypothetical protein [Holophagaceae bacterium]
MPMKILPKFVTEDEMFRECQGKGQTVEYIQANYAQIVKEVEEEMGPHVPSLYLHLLPEKGRPKAGTKVQPVVSKTIKMSPAYWDDLKTLAAKDGISLHSAIRTALLEYSERKHLAEVSAYAAE